MSSSPALPSRKSTSPGFCGMLNACWIAPRRVSPSTSTVRNPASAKLSARLLDTKLFPSLGPVLVTVNETGSPAVNWCRSERRKVRKLSTSCACSSTLGRPGCTSGIAPMMSRSSSFAT